MATPAFGGIRFRLLGPVEFRSGDRWRSIGSTKQRTLLAVLLLHANRVVPVAQLHAELWGDRPYARVKNLLAGCVWRLRAALGEEGNALVTRPGGYQLTVPPEALDLLEYQRLVGLGRARRAADDLPGALEAFTAAVDLWRGEPLADISFTQSVMAERARLEESRLTVEEMRLGLRIELGDPDEVLPELKLIISQHPLRERLHEHLMVALYRSGQQADALGAYRDLRRLLIDELGVEPSKPLRDLQRRILAEDVVLRTTPPPPPAPNLLPAPDPVFHGRENEVKAVASALRDGAVCTVHGMAGTGKSAVALRAAHAVADHFPDGRLYLNLRGSTDTPLNPTDALATVLTAFGTHPNHDLAAQWATLTTARRILLVLDDVRDLHQVKPLLPPGCTAVLTSRTATGAADGYRQLRLSRLPIAAAIGLLRQVVGAERVDAEPHHAATVATWCECLPPAVRAAGGRLASRPEWTIADLADRLADPSQRLEVLTGIQELLTTCTHRLQAEGDQTAVTALTLLAELDLPVVTATTVAALLDTTEGNARCTAERLVDAGLLEPLPHNRYRVAALVRLHSKGADPTADPTTAVQRVVDRYRDQVRELTTRRSGRLSWYREHRGTLSALAPRDRSHTLPAAVDQLRRPHTTPTLQPPYR
ncbi:MULTISPECIES: AfsR/SARP family transcriptional regulator [unclassified Saccharothrix]|uniref:AfsR/SARP family transcriptional regulator n=1 Tax=unclassified Saccharothrix TaxID=2593673 RepID=UPI00307E4D14